MSAPGDVAALVAADLAEWGEPFVELAIYGHGDADAIALAIDDFCRAELGAGVARPVFYRSSIAAVAGVELEDGRWVVVKAHQPSTPLARLAEITRLQRHIARFGGPAPDVLAGPVRYWRGCATAEPLLDGAPAEAHEPAGRSAVAAALAELVRRLEPLTAASTLPRYLLAHRKPDSLWPTPHSRLFDFDATVRGAADIDAVAGAALAAMVPAGRMVLAHGDWRSEHLRFAAGRLVVAYDWESLCKDYEPAVIGAVAHAFCADWTRGDPAQAPSLREARAFVADYEAARGTAFDPAERTLCAAWFAYAVAYTARCAHAAGFDQRELPGTFQHLLATHGVELLSL